MALATVALTGALPGTAWAASAPIIAWTYTVRSGDTLAGIAARMGVSPGDLARANAIGMDAPLPPGTVLQRPDPNMPRRPVRTPAPPSLKPQYAPPAAPRRTRIAPGPTQTTRPATIRSAPAIRAVPDYASTRRSDPGTPHLVWPASGTVSSRFAADLRGRPNNGVDLAAFAGMTVRAAAGGRVVFAGTEPERYGQLIVIDHGGGWATAYAYLGKVTIRQGARVRAGEPIARIGTSGEARKPGLHFELRHDNVPHDPIPALPVRL
jgi:lipoprotein NlpD